MYVIVWKRREGHYHSGVVYATFQAAETALYRFPLPYHFDIVPLGLE